MSPIAFLSAEIATLTAKLGHCVDVAAMRGTDRRGHLDLAPPGLASPNGACRLIPAADGWIAVNLAREEDKELIPAWLGCEIEHIAEAIGRCDVRTLIANASLLGLPVAQVGEIAAATLAPPLLPMGKSAQRQGPPKVVDLSALWAGPLCGAVLAEMGAEVARVESLRRPDPTRASMPEFFRRLNGRKAELCLDLSHRRDRDRLREGLLAADVVITSARPRAFASMGIAPEDIFAARPGLVWVAITGYGWTGEGAARVAFGDDAAAAGGWVRRTEEGEPRFLGDALADPLTGLAAAAGALRALSAGGGVLVDAALARCAAGAAALSGFRDAA